MQHFSRFNKWQNYFQMFLVAFSALLVMPGQSHAFNIAVNVMGAFVHTSRLQYIEFFGKFFEPGGRAFKPLAIRTKYVNVSK